MKMRRMLSSMFALSIMLMLLSSCSKYEEFNGGEFDLYLRSGDIYSISNDEDGSVFNPDGTGYERTNAIPSTLFSWEQKNLL